MSGVCGTCATRSLTRDRRCGSFIGGRGHGYMMLNCRTFDDIDARKLKIRYFNAKGRTATMDAEQEASADSG